MSASPAYLLGRTLALESASAKLAAVAVAPTANPEDEESHLGRNLAMAGAAATPFAGMIGQKPIIHDPHMNPDIHRFTSMNDLSKAARPGDVLVTGKPGGSVWKSFIKPLSGSEMYHSQPVVGRKKGHGLTASAGEFFDKSFRHDTPQDLLRSEADTVAEMAKNYPDATLLRPREGMTPAQLAAFKENALKRSKSKYSDGTAVKTWLKEMFVPKLKAFEDQRTGRICEGNVCSTLPAKAYAQAGKKVIDGKSVKDAFPTDFLRSEAFTPVGAHISSDYKMSPGMRRALPYLSRGAMGLGMAGAVYGASKNPGMAGIPLGLMAGSAAANALGKYTDVPSLLTTAANLGEKGMLSSALKTRVPLLAAGAGAGYLLGNHLKKRMSGDPESEG